MTARKVGFIGGGFMGEAVIRGLLTGGLCAAGDITVSDPSKERADHLAKTYGVRTVGDNRAAARGLDILVLAVKPQVMPEALEEIGDEVSGKTLVISVAAGVKTGTIEARLSGRVVRSMPNMAAQVGQSATAVCAGADATREDMELAVEFFGSMGKVIEVDEDMMDAVTGVSGSGPAYVYLLMEAVIEAGVKAGLSEEQSKELFLQTVKGAAVMAQETGENPETLRKRIMSPNGTTVAAIEVLESRGVRDAFVDAVASAVKRSKELG